MKKALALFALSTLPVSALAQTTPAQMGITPTTLPEVLQVLDNTQTWVPIGTVNPSTHTFTPIGGGGGGGGGGASFQNHAALLAGAATFVGTTIQQQGFYASGDGGAATYQWNATAICPPGNNLAPDPADGIVCVLPTGQSPSTPGRYLLQMTNGVLNALQVGFSADGRDNDPATHTLAIVLNHYMGLAVNFPTNTIYGQSNYYFSQPLELVTAASVSCGDGSRVLIYPPVNLVFYPGVSGIRNENMGTPNYPGIGSYGLTNISGCGVFSLGFGGFQSGIGTSAGNPVIANPGAGYILSSQIGRGVVNPKPLFSVGDGIALFHTLDYWSFDGSITGDILTVTAWRGASFGSPDPGLAPQQLLQGSGVPAGTWIYQTHAQDPTLTGTGQLGTYRINPSIASPIGGAAEAVPGTLTGGFVTEIQSGPPVVATGTTVTGCSTLSGTHCGSGGTLTLSNAPTLSLAYGSYMLPGPNTSSPYGSQMYSVTTSKTGNTLGPFTGSISDGAGGSGNILTITAGPGGLAPSQVVMAGPIVTTTITAPLTIGKTAGIPVASCAGIIAGNVVFGTASGNPVFPPGTTVAGCSGTSLSVNLDQGPGGSGVTNGSNIISLNTNNFQYYALWIGEPVTGTDIPPNTTLTSGATVWPYSNGMPVLTMSNNATGTIVSTVSFGGAIYAAPSGTTLSFIAKAAHIVDWGTGTGGNGTYTLDYSSSTPSGPVYVYDTPSTVYVTGGPRPLHQQDLLWTDAFPFGTMASEIWGSWPKQTIIARITNTYSTVAALATHAAGSGQMWVLPSGIVRNSAGNTFGNEVDGFGIGLNMACGGYNYPITGCGRSFDSNNMFTFNLVGRLTAGNNSGGSSSVYNEYDHNYVGDIAELATVGSWYAGEMLQGEDESTNSHDVISNCFTNGSTFNGIYASGAQWAGTCMPANGAMLGVQPGYVWDVNWYGAVWGAQADSLYVTGKPAQQIPSVNCPAGTPSSSFTVTDGRVTHC